VGIGNVQLGARAPARDPRDLAGVALFGYEIAPTGVPDTSGLGQAWADDILKADGVEVGMVIELGPARSPVEIAGFVSDTTFNGQASLWASPDTWREVLERTDPTPSSAPTCGRA
jgi:putative ABC transport system permease protein